MSEFTLEIERENDGRWISEIPELPGSWLTAARVMNLSQRQKP